MGFTYDDEVIETTVDVLIKGEDYRTAVIQAINTDFLNYTVDFLEKVLEAKKNNNKIDHDWYKTNFISNNDLSKEQIAWNSGDNIKTISNIEGSTSKNVVINYSNKSYDYLKKIIEEIESDSENIDIRITLSTPYPEDEKDLVVPLDFIESMIVINALATKKIALRGGAWSSIGKKVEKPFLDKLCELSGVPNEHTDNSTFVKNKNKGFDREVDYKVKSRSDKWYRIEVKLMGKGNPESADVFFARDSDIIIADTLSDQNKNQLSANGIEYLMTKNNPNVLQDFKDILKRLDVPYK